MTAPATLQVRRDRPANFFAEVSAGEDQRAAKPDFPQKQVEERRDADDDHQETQKFGVEKFYLAVPEPVPADDEQTGGKNQAADAEEADQNPGQSGAVVTDGIRHDLTAGSVERGGITRVIGDQGRTDSDAGGHEHNPDDFAASTAPGELQQIDHPSTSSQ